MMIVFSQSFPEKKYEANICWEMLKDIPDKQFISAIKKILATKEEIYKSTNIIALIRKNAIRNDIPVAGDAWGEVLSLVSSVGSYGSPVFSHSIIERAVKGIGWITICLSTNIGMERAHFLKIYDQLAERETKEVVLSEGLIENKEMRESIDFIAKKLSI